MVYLILLIISISLLFPLKKKLTICTIKIKNNIIPLIIISLMLCLVIFSKSSVQVAKGSILLWANNVLPALFPFLICVELLKQTNFMEKVGKLLNPIMYPLFGVPGSGAFALIMGVTSGYPVGAKVSVDLYEKHLCSKNEAEKLIAFTNSSGPLFIIGAIGSRNA